MIGVGLFKFLFIMVLSYLFLVTVEDINNSLKS